MTRVLLMAEGRNPGVLELLAREIEALVSGDQPPEVGLDIYLAVERQATQKIVAPKFTRLQEYLGEKKSGVFELALDGGNARAGRRVFDNQGTCRKCHRVDGSGGRAGPELAGVAARLQPPQILESVLNPNMVIVPGYGICAVTLKNGESIVGTLMEETRDHLSITFPEGGNRKVMFADIADRSPVMSSMPPMGLALSKTDLRDLITFLRKQTEVEPEEGVRRTSSLPGRRTVSLVLPHGCHPEGARD